jgi:hypothetical protein
MDDYFGDKSNSINFISVAHDQSGNFSGIESNIPDVFNLDNSTSGTLVENMDISSQCLDLRKKKLEVGSFFRVNQHQLILKPYSPS